MTATIARGTPYVALGTALLVFIGWLMAGYPPPPPGGPPPPYGPYGGPQPPNPYGQPPPPPPRQPHPPTRAGGGCSGCDGCDCDMDTCSTIGECIVCDLECLSGCGTQATVADRLPGLFIIVLPIFVLAAWRRRIVLEEQAS